MEKVTIIETEEEEINTRYLTEEEIKEFDSFWEISDESQQ